MRIAHVAVAAATNAGAGSVLLGTEPGASRARARPASEARLGGGSLPGAGAASSTGRPVTGMLGVLWPAGPPRVCPGSPVRQPWPSVLRCGFRGAKYTRC